MYSYCTFMYLHLASWHFSATLTEVFPWFFLSCKTNARVKPAKTGHGPHSYKNFCVVLGLVCFVSLCVLFVYRTTATGWQPHCSLTNIYHTCILLIYMIKYAFHLMITAMQFLPVHRSHNTTWRWICTNKEATCWQNYTSRHSQGCRWYVGGWESSAELGSHPASPYTHWALDFHSVGRLFKPCLCCHLQIERLFVRRNAILPTASFNSECRSYPKRQEINS